MKKEISKSLDQSLVGLKSHIEEKGLSIQEIIRLLSKQGKLLMILLLALPFCQPIQIPGFSTPFGLSIAFIGVCIATRRAVWLPKFILQRVVPAQTLIKIIDITRLWIKKLQRWIHPRMEGISTYSTMNTVSMIVVSLLGICLALPLPIPFSNLSAAWGILCIVLGTLEKDGLFILIGYIIFLITIGFLGSVVVAATRVLF